MGSADAHVRTISQKYRSRLIVEDARELLSVQLFKVAFQNVTYFRIDQPVSMLDMIFGCAAILLACVSPVTNRKKFLQRAGLGIMPGFPRGDSKLAPAAIFFPRILHVDRARIRRFFDLVLHLAGFVGLVVSESGRRRHGGKRYD